MNPGKSCGYETDVHIPFIIRGPGIEEGGTSDLVTTHTDLAPLIMSLVGEEPRPEFDGHAFPVHTEQRASVQKWHEHVNIEYWGGIVRSNTITMRYRLFLPQIAAR
jgi:N-acetylglucosamine-6-sulfatase